MNHTPRTIALSVAMAAICGTLPAFAQPMNAPPPGPLPFAAFDQDGNGIVTEQEFNAVHAERMAARAATGAPMRGAANAPTFANFDLNGDGRLLPDEFAAAHQSLMQGRPGMGAGVTEQEFNAHLGAHNAAGAAMYGPAAAPAFADLDKDSDGRLSPEEFAAAHQASTQNRPGMGPGAGMGSGMGRGMGRNLPTFAEFDLNQDGSLTEQEFYEARANRIKERSQQGYPMRNLANAPDFKTIDRNGDGRVDPQEFDAAQAQHRQQTMQPPRPPQP